MPSTTIYANKGARIADSGSFEAGAGASDFLPVGLYSGYKYRTLLGFSYSFTGWTGISSAVLNLRTSTQFYVAFGSDPDVTVQRLTTAWSEGSADSLSSSNAVTWANQPSATATNQATFDVSTAENDWVSVNITGILQDALAVGVFQGVRIIAVDEGAASDVTEFYSDDTTSKPSISITYSTNNAPNAPTGLTPTGDTIINSLTPTLAGTFSDPDAGDSLSGIQILVYEDNGTTLKWDSGTLTASGSSFSKSYAGPALTGNTFYKWQARTKDAAGAWGAYSAQQRFKVNSVPTAPSQSFSGGLSDTTTLTPVMWLTHNDADASDQNMLGYHIIVTRASDGSTMWDTGDVSVSAIHTKDVTYAGAALSWQTSYRWKGRTKDSNGAWSPYSADQTFTTHSTATPVGLYPSGSAIASSLTPLLIGSRGQSGDTLASAEVEVYASDGTTLIWSSGTFTSGVSATGFTKTCGTTLSSATTYKWRARVTGAIGGTSAWSALQTFLTPDTNTPTITTPIGPGITDLTPDLTFTRGVNFNRHELFVYAEDGTTLLFSDTPVAYTATGSKTVTYAGTALAYGQTYKWKVRVSADGGTNWTSYAGLVSFSTDIAGIPTLTAPIDDSWQTTTTPTFTGNTESAEVISTYRILLYASDMTTLVWDSGDLAGSGTSFSKVYNGSTALTKGAQYFWQAKYAKSGPVPGGYSALQSFHINADPSAPSGLDPAPGTVIADTLTPTFKATFVDSDIAAWGDTPTVYDVEVYRVSDDALMHALTDSTSLATGQNSITRAAEGTALSYEVEYSWRARYTDSKSAAGTWSPLRVFKPSQSPTATLTAPGATLTSPSFTVSWTFSSPGSKAQKSYRVIVSRSSDDVVVYDTGTVISADTSWVMPTGYLLNATDYDIAVTLGDTDDLTSTDTVATLSDWTAPAAPANFSAATDPDNSTVILRWDQSALDPADFSFYAVYRRVVGEETWTPYATITTQSTTEYIDQFAANGVTYDYKVTQFQKVPGDVDLESEEESIASALLDVDVWFVVGADGAADHCFELPVANEGHQQPVQQEVFEPLGSRRKKTARGNVLGNEGTLDVNFTSDEREAAKRRLTYLAETQGPHILKSPFGDVWLVEFAGPVYKYAPGGHVAVTIAWIEVA